MTILPPPRPRHKCFRTGGPWYEEPRRQLDTLMECPECGRWWKFCLDKLVSLYEWHPVRWYDVSARRRIATHETEKNGIPTRWWDCHPNPNRGQP